jgi:hypothetical protein
VLESTSLQRWKLAGYVPFPGRLTPLAPIDRRRVDGGGLDGRLFAGAPV